MLSDLLVARLAAAPRARAGTVLRALPEAVKLDLRAAGPIVERWGEALGGDLPTAPLSSAEVGDVVLLWLGPDQWLSVGGDVRAKLEAAAAGEFAAVTDVSHQLVGVELAGAAAREVLAAGCPLDLHPRVMPEGFASRTLLAKAEVILQRRAERGGAAVFWLFVRRSFAVYLVDWLLEAGRECGVGR